jgi:IclR family transcriptional regulator, pca regulon regulatory protein
MTARTAKTLPTSSRRSAAEPPAAAPATPAPVRDREFVRGLKRGFAVILSFENALTPLTATEVSARTGLTRAVARRYLMTLKALGYIDKIGSSFALTPRVLNLGFKNLSSINVADVALPFMRTVVQTLRESCSLGVLDGHDVVYAARLTADRIMTTRLQVGSRLPAHATAMGRVLLAYLPADQLAAYFSTADLKPLTERTIRDKSILRASLKEIQARGWAANDEESEKGIRTVAVPITDRSGRVIAALNSAAHSSRVSMRELLRTHLPLLLTTARDISRELGARVDIELPA